MHVFVTFGLHVSDLQILFTSHRNTTTSPTF